ncbi:unnamed protein product [Urochloa decumbens]|uniref:Uncharacterized protein n=1 Tax=Urochloa decumbens TaxID=240449 RepID=A0ABC9CDQ1_9POAL
MPQLDLDDQDRHACVGASGDGESKRDTAAAASDDAGAVRPGGDVSATARADGDDAPPESVLLRVSDGIGLAELLCAALRRDGSTKGSSNPKAAAEAATRKHGAPRADSRRPPAAAASKTAVSIGVLPAAGKVVANKERRARAPGRVVVARAWRRPAAGARVFASEAVGAEPVSPKVSCLGAVLPETRAAATPGPPAGKREEERGGCWASAAAALRGLCCSCDSDPRREGEPGARESSDSRAAAPEAPPAAAVLSPPRQMVAGLGDLKRLASRRWPETMATEGRGSV